ncbi:MULTISPECIES: glutamine amidotransferase [Halomonas]|uniref:glutamine amidotransferase n=1 Tax=Halomonas TaxID=2745 RepID=UPI000EDE0240|nr:MULTISPECIES: glutamine amidotransferase [Halomonas]HCR96603.1 glutamine amidotransferase [Halomonas sp.]
MASVVIIKTGDAFSDVAEQHGDFETLFGQQLNDTLPEHLTLRVWDARTESSPLPLNALAGILITGSHSMVSHQEPWSERLKPWLQEALQADIPMLGVCYGHQLMAAAFGGVSDFHPKGRELGTHSVTLTDAGLQDPLFSQLPAHFMAHLTHAQSVLGLPSNTQVLACNSHDAHQALRYGPRQWSVQFHPEFTVPVMRAYIAHQREVLLEQQQDAEAIAAQVVETQEATSLLKRFITLL